MCRELRSGHPTVPTRRLPLRHANAVVALGSMYFLLSSCWTGLAVDPVDRDVLDLIRGLNATGNEPLLGLRYTTGPNKVSPALLLEDPSRHITVPSSLVRRALEVLANQDDVTFLGTVRQEMGDSGTILSFSSETNRFLEIESSGRRDELRLHYTHQHQVRVETFPYRLADGLWHKLAVTLSRDQVSIFVDCQRIYRRTIPLPDRTVPVQPLSLFVGQRNSQHALFKGALQDVKIVTHGNGHLLQCDVPEAGLLPVQGCPTCANNLQDLENHIQEMTAMYEEITLRLSRTLERMSSLEQCQCLKVCDDSGVRRQEGEEWRRDSCGICRCQNGSVECHQEECPPADCKNPVYRDGECCPVCPTNCYYSGKYYDHGDEISPRVCVTCTCSNGRMVCEQQDIKQTCPELECPKSERIEIHGQCCPVCKGTDFCSLGHTCHSNASCVNLATKYACQCHPGFHGDGQSCEDIDECQTAGGPEGHHCNTNTVCVNTEGSYRCDCLNGHSRLDTYECTEHDECVQGNRSCHQDAHCVNSNSNDSNSINSNSNDSNSNDSNNNNSTTASYSCACNTGFTGDGFSCQAYCQGGCRNGGTCIRPGVCECQQGYIGPNCELDIDECALGVSNCQSHSVCINVPGRYHCDCLEGFHSSWPDNNYGSLCMDIDECKNEGEGHTCHPSMQCVNTEGLYTCHCPSANKCVAGCVYEGSEHNDGSKWDSPVDACKECQCQAGRTICHHASCNCSDPNVKLTCCPSCDEGGECQHQELNTSHPSGDSWLYQCQRCECLHGETDCWSLVCSELACENFIQRPGECCPSCADSNPCVSLTLEVGGQDLSQMTCSYNGTTFTHGQDWLLPSDQCTSCQCQAGHICCSYSQACSTPSV